MSSAVHALNGHPTTPQAAHPDRPETVKAPLTPNRAGRVIENDEYAAFARRVLRAYGRRIAQGDIDAITELNSLFEEVEAALGRAVLGHGWAGQGYSAAAIDPEARGVSWLLSETGVPRRVKTAYLTDLDIHDLAAYAASLRRKDTRHD